MFGSKSIIIGLWLLLVGTGPPWLVHLILILLHVLLSVGILNLGHVGSCLLIVPVGNVATLRSLHLKLVQILNHIPFYFGFCRRGFGSQKL